MVKATSIDTTAMCLLFTALPEAAETISVHCFTIKKYLIINSTTMCTCTRVQMDKLVVLVSNTLAIPSHFVTRTV